MGQTIEDIEQQNRLNHELLIEQARHTTTAPNRKYTRHMWIWRTMRQTNASHELKAWNQFRTLLAINRLRAKGLSDDKIMELMARHDGVGQLVSTLSTKDETN